MLQPCFWHCISVLLWISLAVVASGCRRAEWGKRMDALGGPNFKENDETWTRKVRPNKASDQRPTGLSNKAREVEDNLGVR